MRMRLIKVSSDYLKPRVCVLMATYNGSEWLSQQVNSILIQSDVSVKLVISDDISTDQTSKEISTLIDGDDRISQLENSVQSGSAGQNFFHLIRNADTKNFDYIAFSDQDDVWSKDKLISGIKCLKESSASGYSSSALAFWPSGKEKLITQSAKVRSLDFLFEGAGQGCTFILKKNLFSVVKKFCIKNRNKTNNFYYHDWLVYIIARTNGESWYFDKRSFINYRQHNLNDTGAKFSVSGIKKRIGLISNGWYKKQILFAFEISKGISNQNSYLDHFKKIYEKDDSIFRRLSLIVFFFRNGRRKLSDRIILVLATIFKWI